MDLPILGMRDELLSVGLTGRTRRLPLSPIYPLRLGGREDVAVDVGRRA